MSALFSDSPPLPPPFVNVPGISNFRDIGGHPTSTAHASIRRELVYRSADPSKVTAAGLEKLRGLGVKKVFDLRSSPEIRRQGPEWEGVGVDADVFVTGPEAEVREGEIQRVWCPVFADREYGPEQVAERFAKYAERGSSEGFVKAYRDILANGAAAYGAIFRHLAGEDPAPSLVHCTAGKDRTGVACALLYMLCGVPADAIAAEYALTDVGLEHLKPLFARRLLLNPVFGADEAAVDRMIGSQPEKMRATVLMIEREFGGAEAYVTDVVGLSGEEVRRLRRNLLSDEAAVY